MQKENNIKSRWSKNILLFVLNPGFLSLFSPLRFIQIGHFRLWREKREIERERESGWKCLGASDQRVKNVVLCAGERLTMKRKL